MGTKQLAAKSEEVKGGDTFLHTDADDGRVVKLRRVPLAEALELVTSPFDVAALMQAGAKPGRSAVVREAGDNCGTGAGGFQPGNTCAKGGGEVRFVATPRQPVVGSGAGEPFEWGPDGELVEGHIGDFKITTSERGIIQKVSKRTRAELEQVLSQPGMADMLRTAGIRNIRVEPHKGPGKPASGWTAGVYQGVLLIHPRTAEAIAKSTIPERREGGLLRVLNHEIGHGMWDKASPSHREAFASAVKEMPDLPSEIGKIVNLGGDRDTDFGVSKEERALSEIHAEVQAMRRYAPARFAKMPAPLRDAAEAIWKDDRHQREADGDNCGTGAGGFQPGNTCAKGGAGGTDKRFDLNVGSNASKADVAGAGEKLQARWEQLKGAKNVSMGQRQYLGQVKDFIEAPGLNQKLKGVAATIGEAHVFWNPNLEAEKHGAASTEGRTVQLGPAAFEGRSSAGGLGETFVHEIEHLIDEAVLGERTEYTPRLRQMLRGVEAEPESSLWRLAGAHAADHAEHEVTSFFLNHPGHELTDEEKEFAIDAVLKTAKRKLGVK